jgi:hypothetical protein
MHKYRVWECRPDESRLALKCSQGRYHLTRVLNALPPAGATLTGATPHLGFGILLCPISGTVFRVIFESINLRAPTFDPNWNHGVQRSAPGAEHSLARPAL